MVATSVGEVIVVIVPLTPLTANQMSKIEEALQDCAVSIVHLDKLSKVAINDEVIPCMHEIRYDSESTIFIFTSPQKNSKHSGYS